jgi:diguanylate cyclase (GGDEF)-like protein/PAS domain S-box-containing protein
MSRTNKVKRDARVSSFKLLIIIAAAVFVCEAISMSFVYLVGPFHSPLSETLFDSAFLVFLLGPVLYVTLKQRTKDITADYHRMQKEIGERRRIEEQLRRGEEKYARLFDSTTDGIYTTDARGIFTMMNPAGANMFGFDNPEEMIGMKAEEFWRNPQEREGYIAELRKNKSVSAHPIKACKRDGTEIELEASSRILEDDEGLFLGIEGILRDVTERRRSEEELRQLSLTDELTGLNNRRGFLILATQQIKMADRMKEGAVLLYADLDGMKFINDTFGHSEGDRALWAMANILRKTFRASDILARWGGDEFVALAVESEEETEKAISARLQENLSRHNSEKSPSYRLSISVGLTRYDPGKPTSLEELLERGDNLMYEQKMGKKYARTKPSR